MLIDKREYSEPEVLAYIDKLKKEREQAVTILRDAVALLRNAVSDVREIASELTSVSSYNCACSECAYEYECDAGQRKECCFTTEWMQEAKEIIK